MALTVNMTNQPNIDVEIWSVDRNSLEPLERLETAKGGIVNTFETTGNYRINFKVKCHTNYYYPSGSNFKIHYVYNSSGANGTRGNPVNEDSTYFFASNPGFDYKSTTDVTVDFPTLPTYHPTTQTYNITQNLTQCTSDYSDTTITAGEHTITLTANSGYFFTEKGSISVGGVATDITPSGSNKQVITFNATGDVVITMKAIKQVTTSYKFTQHLTHCTSDYNESTITKGSHTITLTADDGYIFSKNGKLTIGTSYKTITASNTNTQAITFTANGNVVLTMEAEQSTPPTPPEPPEPTTYTITQNLTNCTSDFTGSTIESGAHTITLTATAGYVFNEAGRITIGSSFAEISPSGTDKQVVNFRATDNVIITMKANKQTTQLSSFNRLYQVTDSELSALSKVRYYSSDNIRGDYGEYITNLFEIPFNISSMLSEPANIVLGYYTTNIPAKQIDGYKLEIDLGDINCTMPYNNSYDYLNTKATLYIPYFEPITIDSDSCINRTIHLKLFVDLYSGYGTLKVTNDFDEILDNTTNIVVNMIPFVQEKSGLLLRQDVLKFTEIFTPYIVVTNPTPYVKDSTFGFSDNSNKVLNTCTGYVRADNIKFNTLATSSEISEIESLLNNGIYIR